MLQNAEYQTDMVALGERIKLEQGIFYRTQPVPENPMDWYTKLAEPVIFGDLNSDQFADAAVILRSRSGGTGVSVQLAAVINDQGSPRHVTSQYLGDRVQVISGEINNGLITLDLLIHGLHDGLCCPTLPVTWTWRLINNKLIRLP